MQQNLACEDILSELSKIDFLVGDMHQLLEVSDACALQPFEEEILDFLQALSKCLMGRKDARTFPDVTTLGFWMRKSSMLKLKERFVKEDGNIHVGRGIAFHIAPSNVPVNYAYSLVTGLVTGNVNVVRIPSKDFPQVSIINDAINETLKRFPWIRKYVYLVRYEHSQKVNDFFSLLADTRIIWGGDTTIAEIRKSPLRPRAGEITFADRYSLAVISSDTYLANDNKRKVAEDFYNDTYLTDQNACTSPRIVVWVGTKKAEAKKEFWSNLHSLVKEKYVFQQIMGVNKLTSSYLFAAQYPNARIVPHEDNYLVRVQVESADRMIMDYKDNSGYFFEYDCDDIMDISAFCNDTRCQTIGFIGNREEILPLISSGLKGIDRVVPVGKTMDFDLIWDGYNLYERLTRTISVLV